VSPRLDVEVNMIKTLIALVRQRCSPERQRLAVAKLLGLVDTTGNPTETVNRLKKQIEREAIVE